MEDSPTADEQLRELEALLIIGDSIVHGEGAFNYFGWARRILAFWGNRYMANKRRKGLDVQAIGFSGKTTKDLLEFGVVGPLVRAHAAGRVGRTAVMLALGTNDGQFLGTNPEDRESGKMTTGLGDFALRLSMIIDEVVAQGIRRDDIILVGYLPSTAVPYEHYGVSFPPGRARELEDIQAQVAWAEGVRHLPLNRMFEATQNGNPANKMPDLVHPNDLGHIVIQLAAEDALAQLPQYA